MFSNLQTFLPAFSGYLISSGVPPPPLRFNLSLSLISDPFFMHYSITPSSQCITSARLSQTHFVLPLLLFFPLLSSNASKHFSRPLHHLHPLYHVFVPFSGYVTLYSAILSLIYTSCRASCSATSACLRCCRLLPFEYSSHHNATFDLSKPLELRVSRYLFTPFLSADMNALMP